MPSKRFILYFSSSYMTDYIYVEELDLPHYAYVNKPAKLCMKFTFPYYGAVYGYMAVLVNHSNYPVKIRDAGIGIWYTVNPGHSQVFHDVHLGSPSISEISTCTEMIFPHVGDYNLEIDIYVLPSRKWVKVAVFKWNCHVLKSGMLPPKLVVKAVIHPTVLEIVEKKNIGGIDWYLTDVATLDLSVTNISDRYSIDNGFVELYSNKLVIDIVEESGDIRFNMKLPYYVAMSRISLRPREELRSRIKFRLGTDKEITREIEDIFQISAGKIYE